MDHTYYRCTDIPLSRRLIVCKNNGCIPSTCHTHFFLNRFGSGGGEGLDEEERDIYISHTQTHTYIYISV